MNHIEKIKEPHGFGGTYYVQFRKSVLDSVNVLLIVNKFNPQSVYRIEGDFGWGQRQQSGSALVEQQS